MRKKVLLVDDQESVRLSLGFWLRRNDFQVTLCAALEEARQALALESFDFVITDFQLTPHGREGLLLLEAARAANPAARCILVTAMPYDELPRAVRSATLYGLQQKPVDVFELLRLLGAGPGRG